MATRLTSTWPQAGVWAARGLRTWTVRQVWVAVGASVAFGLMLGVATVLIPNSLFAREIPPVWWNYPVWLLTSAFSGMLVATYATGHSSAPGSDADGSATGGGEGLEPELRTSRFGIAGGALAWFAVGCPVCNKLALLALGYSGAITWFAPVQPFLAVGGLLLTGTALAVRLRGQVACPSPARPHLQEMVR
ncbi:hypothetical protein [Promicromonospora sp. NPDC023987]|uniref:hypothetical protein n=1 Tax=Promicromonospora sp. NPDC023987 TaxID=3155360 RepID=UPI0033F5FBE7